MLHRHDEEHQPVEELDPVHPGDPHVEEDPEQDGEGNQLEDGGEEDGGAEEDGDAEGGEALVPDPHYPGALTGDDVGRHDDQGGDMAHGPHSSRADPRSTQKPCSTVTV